MLHASLGVRDWMTFCSKSMLSHSKVIYSKAYLQGDTAFRPTQTHIFDTGPWGALGWSVWAGAALALPLVSSSHKNE